MAKVPTTCLGYSADLLRLRDPSVPLRLLLYGKSTPDAIQRRWYKSEREAFPVRGPSSQFTYRLSIDAANASRRSNSALARTGEAPGSNLYAGVLLLPMWKRKCHKLPHKLHCMTILRENSSNSAWDHHTTTTVDREYTSHFCTNYSYDCLHLDKPGPMSLSMMK